MRLITVMIVFLLVSSVSLAEQPAVQWSKGESTYGGDGPFTLGFRFRVKSPILVTSLGAFDAQGDGLNVAHTVAIWSTLGGDPLRSVAVPAGNAAPLSGVFRYTPIAPLMLMAGAEYVVGASDFGIHMDDYGSRSQGFVSAREIAWLAARETYTPAGGLDFPTIEGTFSFSGYAWFGGNFRFIPIPEANSTGIALSAFVCCTYWGRAGTHLRRRFRI